MKVLMLGWELPPYNSGGLGVACYQLCKSLAAQNINIEFVLPYKANHIAGFMKISSACPVGVASITRTFSAYDSYKYHYIDGRVEWHDIYSQQAHYEQAVARLADVKQFDLVHAHDWLTFRAALRLKERTGCPIVLHVHSIESDRAGGVGGNPLVKEIEATSLALADQIIAVSNFTKQAIVDDYGIPADKIIVVHNSIDVAYLDPLDSSNAFAYLTQLKAQGYRIVSSIGRLTVQKGIPNFLRAAQKVIQFVPKTIFLIVGSGEQYNELLELSAHLGITRNVIFTGFLRGKQWRDAFAIADLFVMPSITEPFGLTPLEAIGYGTPTIISKQAGVSEILNHCLKIEPWDIDEIANKIIAVIQDDALSHELILNARREVGAFSWLKSSQKISTIYHQQISKGVAA